MGSILQCSKQPQKALHTLLSWGCWQAASVQHPLPWQDPTLYWLCTHLIKTSPLAHHFQNNSTWWLMKPSNQHPSPPQYILAAFLLCIPTNPQIYFLYMEKRDLSPVASHEGPLVFTVYYFTCTHECWIPEELGGRTSPPCSQVERGQDVEGTSVSQSYMAVMLGGQRQEYLAFPTALFMPRYLDTGSRDKWGRVWDGLCPCVQGEHLTRVSRKLFKTCLSKLMAKHQAQSPTVCRGAWKLCPHQAHSVCRWSFLPDHPATEAETSPMGSTREGRNQHNPPASAKHLHCRNHPSLRGNEKQKAILPLLRNNQISVCFPAPSNPQNCSAALHLYPIFISFEATCHKTFIHSSKKKRTSEYFGVI